MRCYISILRLNRPQSAILFGFNWGLKLSAAPLTLVLVQLIQAWPGAESTASVASGARSLVPALIPRAPGRPVICLGRFFPSALPNEKAISSMLVEAQVLGCPLRGVGKSEI
jgi:hypothetical protein